MLNRLTRYFETAGRERARRELLALSDAFLAEHGFSRHLLLQGKDAWPWRIEDNPNLRDEFEVLPMPTSKPALNKDKIDEALQPLDWVA